MALCLYCKEEKDLPEIMAVYTDRPDEPVINVRVCKECRQDLQICADQLNLGTTPQGAQDQLAERILRRRKAEALDGLLHDGCFTGDCDHNTQAQCDRHIFGEINHLFKDFI